MSNLIVDIGNTRVKLAVLKGEEIIYEESFACFDGCAMERVKGFVGHYDVRQAVVSSTRVGAEEVVDQLKGCIERVLLFNSTTSIPIKNSYESRETLGSDRLAAAVGGWSLYGNEADALLVVDFGSAITVDLVTRDGGFEGGVISPGVAMRFRALHEFTARLPLCTPTERVLDVARTTNDAIEQGVMEGVAYEIEGHIEKNRRKYDKIVVIFAGGDAKKFANRIKNTIFAQCELVIVGLNRILEYNNAK